MKKMKFIPVLLLLALVACGQQKDKKQEGFPLKKRRLSGKNN